MVERNLAKVEVASSRLVSRSISIENSMFQNLTEFYTYIESIPPVEITFAQREALLVEARALIEAHGLLPLVPIVTVTGTNGKGSTVYALAAILVHQGLNVCAFTSPHLSSYTERFAYNLQHIDEATLLRLANKIVTLTDLSHWNFFFILLFIHLLWCKELALDCVILEVGIGGRLDPTNILDASLVILTQVALDHAEILGHTREAIGFEKAGLLREGIPFVCGDPHPPITVLEKAEQLHCRFYQIHQQFGFRIEGDAWSLWLQEVTFSNLAPPMMHVTSLSCAVQAAKLVFPELPYTQTFMAHYLPELHLPGRYQQVSFQGRECVVDVSHNPAAVEALAKFLQLLPSKPMIAIFGIKAAKDVANVIDIMKNVIAEWYLVPINSKGGMEMEALAKCFEPFGIKPHLALTVADAMQQIVGNNKENARVVAFGSFRIAGPTLELIYSSAAE